jgi:hypothetical protein
MNSPTRAVKPNSGSRLPGAAGPLGLASRAHSLREQAGLAAQILPKGSSSVVGTRTTFEGALRERSATDMQQQGRRSAERSGEREQDAKAATEQGARSAGAPVEDPLVATGADAAAHAAMLLLTPATGQPVQSGQVTVSRDAKVKRGEAQAEGEEQPQRANSTTEPGAESSKGRSEPTLLGVHAQQRHADGQNQDQSAHGEADKAVESPGEHGDDATTVARETAGDGRTKQQVADDRGVMGVGVLQQLGAVRSSLHSAERASTGATEIWSLRALDKAGGSERTTGAKAEQPKPPHARADSSVVDQVQHGMIAALRHLPSPAGQRVVQMKLNPAELGPVRIHLRVAGDAVAVSFQVTSTSAEDALKRSASVLRDSLERRGLRVIEMAFERAPEQAPVMAGSGELKPGATAGKPIAGKALRAEDAAQERHEEGVLQTVTLRLDAHA